MVVQEMGVVKPFQRVVAIAATAMNNPTMSFIINDHHIMQLYIQLL